MKQFQLDMAFQPKQLLLSISEDNFRLEHYVKAVSEDVFFRKIIESDAFMRLKEVSFLGAIDYLPEYRHISRESKTRAQHSLNVAALALMISKKRGYSAGLTKHLVTAGLLHDIGHPPLSHSVEPFLKSEFGYGHHEMGEMLLDGDVDLGKPLAKLLLDNVDVSFIKQLIDGQAKDEDGGDLFSSKINLDTIEGIIRSKRYLKQKTSLLSPARVAVASFTSELENRTAILDAFWMLKNDVYNYLITSGNGLLADLQSQRLFSTRKLSLSKDCLFKSEKSWQQKYSDVFSAIRNVESSKGKNAEINNSFMFIKREYYIDSTKHDDTKRYLYTKKKTQYQII